MKQSLMAFTFVALAGALALSSPALAQQKTVKACQEEWRADKAGNQAKGITEKAYVAECRGGSAAAKPAAAEPQAAPAAAPQGNTGQKTAKACRDEWRANKATNQANGVTEKAYVTQCRGGETAAQPSAPPPAAQTPAAAPAAPSAAATPAAPPPTPPSSRAKSVSAPAATAAAPGPNQFTTEADAKGRCPSGPVVWVNLDSKIYHYAGHKAYGHTKSGAYMCESDTTSQGMRASKNEKRPG
jgi:hypothetical protein